MKYPKTVVRKVAANKLTPHPLAQRETVNARLRKLKDALDLDAIGVLHVVEYKIDGKDGMWIVDGQHRWRALMDLDLGEWEVEIKLHLDVKDNKRASELFLLLNDRAPVATFEKFKNELSAGHREALAINSIAEVRGLKVSKVSGDGKLSCIAALKRTYRRDDGTSLQGSLDIIRAAWGPRAAALEGTAIEGIGLVIATYNGTIERDVMAKKLAKYPGGASGLIGDAKGLREFRKTSLARCAASIVIETYNRSRRSGQLDPL